MNLPDNDPTEGAIFLGTVLHVPAEVVQAALNLGGYWMVTWPSDPEAFKAELLRQIDRAIEIEEMGDR